jgi:hypothetical protein
MLCRPRRRRGRYRSKSNQRGKDQETTTRHKQPARDHYETETVGDGETPAALSDFAPFLYYFYSSRHCVLPGTAMAIGQWANEESRARRYSSCSFPPQKYR